MLALLNVALAVAFAAAIVAHGALVVGLARVDLWRAPLAIIVPPLAPYWGFQRGMRRRVGLWWCAVATYAVVLAMSVR